MKIVACNIFRREVEAVAPDVAAQTTWLLAGLHVDFDRLKEALVGALEGNEQVVCFYGAACHPDMGELIATNRGRYLARKGLCGGFPARRTTSGARRAQSLRDDAWLAT